MDVERHMGRHGLRRREIRVGLRISSWPGQSERRIRETLGYIHYQR